MKKSRIITAVAATVLSATICGAAFSGCAQNDNKGDVYVFDSEITVVGGTGGGTLKDGSLCTVSAEVPEGKKFEKWVNEYGEVLSTANPYTFTVDGDLNITAVYSDMQTYRIEVIGGTLTGTEDTVADVYAGQTVSVTALSSQAHKFKKWLINGKEESTANPYVFTADADTKIEAVVEELYLIAVSGGTVGDGGDVRKIFNGGDECTLNAYEEQDGLPFAYWYTLDADGNTSRVSFDSRYTFTVTGTEKYYAKYGNSYTVTVENGFIDGVSGDTVKVVEGESITIRFNEDAATGDMVFDGWVAGGNVISTEKVFTITNIIENMEISALLVEKHLEVPEMSANQMFRRNDAYTLEFDRGSKSLFTNDTACIMFYIYTSPYADKDDYVGRMKIDNEGEWRLATADGKTLWAIEGGAGNFWLDTKNGFHQGKGHRGNTMDMFKAAIGKEYDENTPYYLAAQSVAKDGSEYSDSAISQIGPQVFMQNDVEKYTVTVDGGIIVGANVSTLQVYEGQQVTVYCDSDTFAGWSVNDEVITENPYTFTVTGDITVSALYAGKNTVTVDGGVIKDSGSATGQYEAGDTCTVVANAAESGKAFAYWYALDGENEVILSENEEYTFAVSRSLTLYAKYANVLKLTVSGGYIEGLTPDGDGAYSVLDLREYKIKLDLSKIPEGKGFTGWTKDGENLSAEYEFTLQAGSITADTLIEAKYEDLKHEFGTPAMDKNQLFTIRLNNADDYVLQLDKGAGTVFTANVDHVKFYIYTSPYADKDDYAGVFIFDKKSGKANAHGHNFRLATVDGKTLWALEGVPNNVWLETLDGYNSPGTKENFFNMWREILGDKFNADTPYYVAAQICGKEGSVYAPGDISAIGPQAFILNNVAKHTVTVRGGTVKNSPSTTVEIYEGQPITVICTSGTFKHWLINGEVAQGSQKEYTFTVTRDTEVTAVLEGSCTITVEGGTLSGGQTSATVESGDRVTITANAPGAGKAFAYWYTLAGDTENILSRDEVYSFNADSDVTVIAKFVNTHTLTVTGGTVSGMDKAENGEYTVLETDGYTVKLDLSAIPGGKGFTGWAVNGENVSTAYEYVFAAGSITADTQITAVYADLVHEFNKPVNENNEFFKVLANGTIEIDRKNNKVESEFDNANIERMLFYFYTSPYVQPTAENSAGQVWLVRDGNKFRFETLAGVKLWDVKGGKADLYHDNAAEAGYPNMKEVLFALVKSAAGDSFNANTPYYVAVQACGKAGSVYAPSEISAIGPQAFIYNDVEKFTVTIDGGVVENTSLSTVSIYKGQLVTIISDNANFKQWSVNGQTVTDNPYTFTVTESVSITAVLGGESTVSVTGGKINGEASAQVTNGDEVTVTADAAAAGTKFAFWYTTDGVTETVLSKDESYTFTVSEDINVIAKFGNLYTISVTGGTVNGGASTEHMEYDTLTVKLDLSAIPEGKGFTHWEVGGQKISEEQNYTFAAKYFTADTQITAVYAEQVHEFATPENAQNQMLKNAGDYVIDIDRGTDGSGTKVTAFQNNVENVKFYIYTSATANKNDSVGAFKLERYNGGFRLATMDGETLWELEGSAGNIWISTKNNYHTDRKGNFFSMIQKVLGENYSETQAYYFAAQTCGKDGSIYAPSEISDIGSQEFRYKEGN